MSFEFHCPWCKSDAKVRGSADATWRFKIACDACNREMVLTYDGKLSVDRTARTLARTEDQTVPFQTHMAKLG